MYSPDKYEILAEVLSVACVTVISLLFGRKMASIEKPVYLIQSILVALYGLTWVFSVISCMATSTNNGNVRSCMVTLFNFIIVYTLAKLSFNFYVVEKIYILSVPQSSRLKTPIYLICLGALLPYVGMVTLMAVYRIMTVSEAFPYHCTVGFETPASAAALGYSTLLSLMQIVILVRHYIFPNAVKPGTQQTAAWKTASNRTAIAVGVSLIASIANYCVLLALQGRERGLLASSVCSIDITIVTCVAHWASSHSSEMQCTVKALQKTSSDEPVKLEIKQHQEIVVLSEAAS